MYERDGRERRAVRKRVKTKHKETFMDFRPDTNH